MEKNCEQCHSCNTVDNTVYIPYYVYEAEKARDDKKNRRLFWGMIVAILLAFFSNVAWLIYESQFETLTYQQDGNGINNINYGDQGDIINNESAGQNESSQERSS